MPQPNGYHVQQPAQLSAHTYNYDPYDNSDYDSPASSRPGSHAVNGGWPGQQQQPLANGAMANGYDGFDFETTHLSPSINGSASNHRQNLSVQTGGRGGGSSNSNRDSMSQHLLYENALLDSSRFEILDIEEVDALKKERERLDSRVHAARHKLALESKVKDAAYNLQRLYALQRSRPDTPQRNDSRESRSSFFGGDKDKKGGSRVSDGTESLLQAHGELADSMKKVDDLNQSIRDLLEKRAEIERRLLSHTAAVLAEEANNKTESAVVGLSNGHHMSFVENEFDGLRGILHGVSPNSVGKTKEYEDKMASVQGRLEQLNLKLRGVIEEAGRTLGRAEASEKALDQSDDPTVRLDNRLARLENNLTILEDQQQDLQSTHQSNTQSSGSQQKLTEYEDTVAGLWEILQSDRASDEATSPGVQEPFSLPAFNTRVQHIFDRAQSAKEQQDILRRQIQQQRDLNGKSDAEKDMQLDQLQQSHNELQQSHNAVAGERDAVQEELAKFMVQHQQAEAEATHLRSEQTNIMNEIEEMRRTVDTRQQERDEISRTLESHQSHSKTLQSHIQDLEAQITELSTTGSQSEDMASAKAAAEAKVTEVQKDMENLESEVIRLTTELTMAKADLDVAHGSRAERAGAQAAEVESLSEKNRSMAEHASQLERELQEMTTEFQAMTKESIDLEKEREQLDGLIDGLRERVDVLEGQLSDEKARWLGMRTPGPGSHGALGEDGYPKESMSMTVLRQEFKKMVRETRAEGVRLIRAEQEERRRLEAEVRKMRQANGPLGKHLQAQNQNPANLSPSPSTSNAPPTATS